MKYYSSKFSVITLNSKNNLKRNRSPMFDFKENMAKEGKNIFLLMQGSTSQPRGRNRTDIQDKIGLMKGLFGFITKKG